MSGSHENMPLTSLTLGSVINISRCYTLQLLHALKPYFLWAVLISRLSMVRLLGLAYFYEMWNSFNEWLAWGLPTDFARTFNNCIAVWGLLFFLSFFTVLRSESWSFHWRLGQSQESIPFLILKYTIVNS